MLYTPLVSPVSTLCAPSPCVHLTLPKRLRTASCAAGEARSTVGLTDSAPNMHWSKEVKSAPMAVTRRAIDGSVHMAVTWQRGPRDPRWRARRRRCSAAPQRSPGARARAPWRAPRRPRRLCRWRAAPWAASCLRLSWRRESRLLNATSTCERRLGATRGTTALTRGTYQQLHCLRVCGGNWHMSSFNRIHWHGADCAGLATRARSWWPQAGAPSRRRWHVAFLLVVSCVRERPRDGVSAHN